MCVIWDFCFSFLASNSHRTWNTQFGVSWFKYFDMVNQICKFCWGTTSSNSEFLIMVWFYGRMISQQGAHPTSREWVGLTKTKRTNCWKGWLMHVTLRNLVSGRSNLVLCIWVFSPKSMIGSQYFTRSEVRLYAWECGTPHGILGLDVMS
jgi:hypothetical protein